MTIGIDIGKHLTKISNLVNGKIDIVLNNSSGRSSKTLISFKDIRYYGDEAVIQQVNNYKNTVNDFMLSISNNEYNYIYPNRSIEKEIGYTIVYNNNDYNFSPEYLLTMYLNNINKTLIKNDIYSDYATLSVPNNFNLKQKKIVLECIKNAGWKNPYVIDRAISIGLEYGFYRSANKTLSEDDLITNLFIDFGETSTELSLISFKEWELNIKAVETIDLISGWKLKEILYNICKEEYRNMFHIDLNDRSKQSIKIYRELDKTIKNLSINKSTKFIVENIIDGRDFIFDINNSIMEEYLKNNINCLDQSVKSILKKSSLKMNDIKSIEILGGISRVPYINNWLKSNFKTKLGHTMNAEESVAKGCTLYSSIVSPKVQMRKFSVLKTIHSSIKLNCNKRSFVLFKKGDHMPKSKKISINTSKDIDLDINGNFNFLIKLDKKVKPPVEVFIVFDIDINGIITVSNAYYKIKEVIKEISTDKPENKELDKSGEVKENTSKETSTKKESKKLPTKKESKETPTKKETEKVIYKHINLSITDKTPLFIPNDHFKDYIRLEKKFSIDEEKIKHRDILINDLESMLYEFNDLLDNKFVKFINPITLLECRDRLNKDLEIFNNYLVDEQSTKNLEKIYDYYKSMEEIYTKNKEAESKNNSFINSILQKITNHINHFDKEENILPEFIPLIDDIKDKLSSFKEELEEKNNSVLNKPIYEREYVNQSKTNKDLSKITKALDKIIKDYQEKKEEIKKKEELEKEPLKKQHLSNKETGSNKETESNKEIE
jgi:heat shock 70kDa protein 4